MDVAKYNQMKADIAARRAQTRNRLEKLQRQLAAFTEDEAALDRVWCLLGNQIETVVGEAASTLNGRGVSFGEAVATRRGELMRAIRNYIAHADPSQDITSEMVRRWLEQQHKDLLARVHRSSIPGALSQLAESRELALIESGSGRRHSIFRKTQHPPTAKGDDDGPS